LRVGHHHSLEPLEKEPWIQICLLQDLPFDKKKVQALLSVLYLAQKSRQARNHGNTNLTVHINSSLASRKQPPGAGWRCRKLLSAVSLALQVFSSQSHEAATPHSDLDSATHQVCYLRPCAHSHCGAECASGAVRKNEME
jgi:hypothetical protein